jgi:hypothetical protein
VHKIPKTKTKWGPRFVFEVLKGRPKLLGAVQRIRRVCTPAAAR